MRSIDPTFGDIADLRAKMVVWARSLTRGGHNAEDLVQSALLKMLANRHRAPALVEDVYPWARVILLNEFRGSLRGTRRVFVDIDDVPLVATDNPFTAVYCRQVCRIALGLDAAMLLAEPEAPESNTARTQRRRARQRVEQVAA